MWILFQMIIKWILFVAWSILSGCVLIIGIPKTGMNRDYIITTVAIWVVIVS